jgi:predicted O-methyltransferase YrrM
MSKTQWAAVDRYIAEKLAPSDPALDETLASIAKAKLPAINVSPGQGKFLQVLALAVGASRILEIGTLAAYSTIWLARALAPGGHLVTLEADEKHAEISRRNLHAAGLDRTVELRLGRAADSLRQLAAEGQPPFDLIFIDADKESIPEYVAGSLKLSRRGTLLVVDNVVREGRLADPESTDPGVLGARRLHDRLAQLAAEGRVAAATLQTVGGKGYDGFTLAVVLAP